LATDRSWMAVLAIGRLLADPIALAMATGIMGRSGATVLVGIILAGTIRTGVGAAVDGPGTGTTIVFVQTTAGTTAAGTTTGGAIGTRLWLGEPPGGGWAL
jgi:hypothetical protein